MQGFGLVSPTFPDDPQTGEDRGFSVGGSLAPQPGVYTTQGGPYDYEWMNALTQAAEAIGSALPVFQDLLGTVPTEPQPPSTGGGIVVEPVPWYEQVPPWVLAAGAAIGVVLIVKLLED